MGVHSNQTWLVFQSPILQNTEITLKYQHALSQLYTSSEAFFSGLFQTLHRPQEHFLTPYALAHHFTAFQSFTSPTHYRALHSFLLECRANLIDEPFIETLQDLPLSSKLQQLFFLYYEYLLFKKNHPHLIDPWDLIQRADSQTLPFDHLVWVDFVHATTFSKQLCQALSHRCTLTSLSAGPTTLKTHTFSLSRFVEILQRIRKKHRSYRWTLSPTAHDLQAHLDFALTGQSAWIPSAFQSFDDIYGYLAHTEAPHSPSPPHEQSPTLHAHWVEDHVLPEALTQDPLWKTRTPLNQAQAKIQATLWTQHLALQELSSTPDAFTSRHLITPHTSLFPDPEDLHFLSQSQLNCQISPWCFTPQLQTETMVRIYTH